MYKYQNVSDSEQVVTVDGNVQPRRVAAGAETVSSVPIENPNFKYIGEADERATASVEGVQNQQPNAVTEGELATNQQEGEQ